MVACWPWLLNCGRRSHHASLGREVHRPRAAFKVAAPSTHLHLTRSSPPLPLTFPSKASPVGRTVLATKSSVRRGALNQCSKNGRQQTVPHSGISQRATEPPFPCTLAHTKTCRLIDPRLLLCFLLPPSSPLSPHHRCCLGRWLSSPTPRCSTHHPPPI
jgi:hypothetical protein